MNIDLPEGELRRLIESTVVATLDRLDDDRVWVGATSIPGIGLLQFWASYSYHPVLSPNS